MKRSRRGRLDTEAQILRYHLYNVHCACFNCRKMFNKPSWLRRLDRSLSGFVCPQCGAVMHDMGKEFKPPRRNNIGQWRKIELLFQRGYRWETTFERYSIEVREQRHEYLRPVSRSPRAKTLREAKTDYPPRG